MKLTKRQQEVLMVMPRMGQISYREICNALEVQRHAEGGITATLQRLRDKRLIAYATLGGWCYMLTDLGRAEVRRLEEGSN